LVKFKFNLSTYMHSAMISMVKVTLYGLYCADVPLRNCSINRSITLTCMRAGSLYKAIEYPKT